jgi:transcription initiation factor TFIIIB Brf1 subunit/transcription initiation factor TFIIB
MPFAELAPEREAPRGCPECGGPTRHDARHGETACSRCGLVVAEALAWDRSGDAASPTAPALAIPYALVAGNGGLDRPPRAASPLAAPPLAAPPRRSTLTRSSDAPRAHLRARAHLNRMSDTLRLPPDVAQDAFRRVKRLHREGRTQGRRVEAVAAAALLNAARDRGLPRTVREVAEAAGVKPADVGRAQRALAETLRTRVLPSRPARYLPALASRAGLPPMAAHEAARLLQTAAGRHAANGRRPEPLAAAALVLAARRLEIQHSLAGIAAQAGVSRQAVYDALAAISASSHMNDFGGA